MMACLAVMAGTATHGIAIAADAKPSVLGSLGRTSTGWSGAVPVYMELRGGLSLADYPYARAQVTTPAGETYYTPMAWNARASRFEGTICIGSWYGNGCVDPHLGIYAVVVQLDNDRDFSSIDYHDPSGVTFKTYPTYRWNGVPAGTHGHDTEYLPTWNGDHWECRVHDFSIGYDVAAVTLSNVAVAIPFYPTTARITNMTVAVDGVWVPPGTVDSTNDCWWWEERLHTLYVQKASLVRWSRHTVAFAFDSDTDLFATRIDKIVNSGNGTIGYAYNGLVFANQYLQTPMVGGAHELSGDQVAAHVRDQVAEDDINIDCAERVAVPVDDTMLPDASAKYPLHIKWRQDEWKDYIQSEDNSSIVVRVHSDDTPVTGWAQQLTNHIAVERTQTYSAGKRYIKNVYTLTNLDAKPHKLPFVWGREQFIGIDEPANDKGRYAGDAEDRITESKVAIASLPSPWFTAYDSGVFAAMGVIFPTNEPVSGYFLVHTPLKEASEWPLAVTNMGSNCTQNTSTFFERVYDAVAPGASVNLTFWQWGGDFSSWDEIRAAIDHDARELNGLADVPPPTPPRPDTDAEQTARATALGLAAAQGRLDLVNSLLTRKADLNALDAGGATPLMRAADQDRPDDATTNMIKVLLARGAKVNARDKDGNTPLMRAAAKGQLEMIRFLAARGAKVNARGKDGKTPLMRAVDRRQVEVVRVLAEKGADVDAEDREGRTPLVKLAWSKGPLDLFKLLLEKGANPNARDKDGNTALMLAANRVGRWPWKVAWVKALAEKGARVNIRDKDGKTPLMKAAAEGQRDLVKVLVEHGADVSARDRDDHTAWMLAAGTNRQHVVEFLKQHGAKE